MKLGVNIDHVATLRQVRHSTYPEPIAAALIAETAGAYCITVHLREDRRHIHDRDVELLKRVLHIPLNLEMAATKEMTGIAKKIKPSMVTLVPEKRQELTTEGGLNLKGQGASLKSTIKELSKSGIPVSLFVDPVLSDIDEACHLGAQHVELHTGAYAEAHTEKKQSEELSRILSAAEHASNLGLGVHAGHGLNYFNVSAIAQCEFIESLQIGHAIIGRAVLVGLERAILDMQALLT